MMLELKHATKQLICAKTRAQFTVIEHPDSDKDAVLARGGVRPPDDVDDENAYMVQLYMDRYAGQMIDNSHLISTRQQWHTESDLVMLHKQKKLNLEYDFKRKPINARMVESPVGEHLTFDTEPWKTVEEARIARGIFDQWREHRCLKTLDDYYDFEDFYLTRLALRKLNMRLTKGGDSTQILKRMFLRAWVKNMWGIQKDMTYKQMVAWLNDQGCSATLSDISAAAKSDVMPIPRAVPDTHKVRMLLGRLKAKYPDLRESNFLM